MTHIMFERTGGFMGRKVAIKLDLDDLPGNQADILKRLLNDADFFSLPENLVTRPIADGFTYTITAETDDRHKTIRVSDANTPDSLRPLILELNQFVRVR